MPNNPAPPGDTVDTTLFLNLAAGRWWEFKDSNSGQTVRIDCVQPSPGNPNRLQLKVSPAKIMPDMVLEVSNHEYTLVESIWEGKTATWKPGLHFPAHWKVGDTVTAKSQSGASPTGNTVQLSVTLKQLDVFEPPSGAGFPPHTKLRTMPLQLIVKDVGLGSILADTKLTFAEKLGIVKAAVQNFGSFHILEFKKWSGGH